MEHLKCGQSKERNAVSVKYTPDFEGLVPQNNVNDLINFFFLDDMLK